MYKYLPLYVFVLVALFCCTKKVGVNKDLALTDKALFDSCQDQSHKYYKNDAVNLLSGSAGPHGSFKLRFNSIAAKALTNNGKLPAGATMPDGAMVIKDIYSGGSLISYAFMYKKSGSWLWGEVTAKKQVTYSVKMDVTVCTNCHSQQGNRDYIVSFNFY